MTKCAITYEVCEQKYSKRGLAKLSPKLDGLHDLPYSAAELRKEAALRIGKMSIQGVQPKLSAKLLVKKQELRIVDSKGTYIIKPQHDLFRQVPENEDLTMKLAKIFGINVPLTGLVYSKDGSLNYFIKRFDRYSSNKKRHQEDFAQLTNNTRETKYKSSMEKLVRVIDEFCTFPVLEKRKLFRRILFCFITGNEDMHLKNFSLITINDVVELSPAYDLLNSTIAMGGAEEELALPLAGKKNNLEKSDFFEYYARERLSLNEKVLQAEENNLLQARDNLESLIGISFLDDEMKKEYLQILSERYARLS